MAERKQNKRKINSNGGELDGKSDHQPDRRIAGSGWQIAWETNLPECKQTYFAISMETQTTEEKKESKGGEKDHKTDKFRKFRLNLGKQLFEKKKKMANKQSGKEITTTKHM